MKLLKKELGYQFKMKIEIINIDITTLQVDAIVNAANNSLTGGGGVDGAIHKAAGKELTDYCSTLKGCATGLAKITPGFNLPAKYIIHAVGPVWNNGTENEEALLQSCYQNSLQLAVENNCATIAFPCISTGAYRFPFDKAANIALNTITKFLNKNESIEKVCLVVFGEKDLKQYKRIFLSFGETPTEE
jgi:O-acetyl-ADP-ribose deacetylase